MNSLDENAALATVFANIRRKKRNNDLITIAKAFEYLVKLYGSQKSVAEKVGLSTEMVREFLAVLKLPKEVRYLISERKIDSIDVLREISVLKETKKQIAASEAFVNSLSKDARDMKRLIKDAELSVNEAKKTILDAKPKGLHIFFMDFDNEIYRAIIQHAKVMKVKPAELVREIVLNWLKEKNRIDEKQRVR
jgi:ABC-type Zn uptake system ZnuABC Zn-binding protein ZnuA